MCVRELEYRIWPHSITMIHVSDYENIRWHGEANVLIRFWIIVWFYEHKFVWFCNILFNLGPINPL
jgi:hypothetical protein